MKRNKKEEYEFGLVCRSLKENKRKKETVKLTAVHTY
jgi:hypothetical protein